ncbi:MAG: MarR family transcriptional regulator [Nocardioides sp.]|nr:MarR family transcriptional regulator [Nocardioides sp.]
MSRPIGLTVPQYASLEVLRQRPGVSNAELARATFVSRQSVNVLLRGLESAGLVTRVVAEVEERMLSTLDVTERGSLRHLLRGCLAGLRA